jgi:tetratricopeptide (TPR) repeat protein
MRWRWTIAAWLLWLPAAWAQADDKHCGLTELAELKMQPNHTGAVLIPVDLNGRPALLGLDTGGFWSVLRASLVKGMPQQTATGLKVVGAGGGGLDRYVTMPQIGLDRSVVKDAEFFVGPEELSDDPQYGGTLAANLLQQLDVDIDPGHGRVRLFQQDHCKGGVVYWQADNVASLPFDFDSNLITIPVTLDGKPMRATIDTGATTSVLSLKAAKALFGLDTDSPGVKPSAKTSTLDGRGLKLYKVHFKTLQIGSVSFSNPELTLGVNHLESVDHDNLGDKAPDLVLGMHQLRLLHLYIAYAEKKLYASALLDEATAEARAAGKPVQLPVLPSDPLDLEDAQELVDQANTQLTKGEPDQALLDFSQALQIAPDQAWIYFDRGIVQANRKDYNDALADFSRGLELTPDDAVAYVNRAHLYLLSGDSGHALQDADKALQLDPRLKDAYVQRAMIRIGRHDNAGALPDLDQAVQLEPKAGLARANRCVVLMRLERYQAALDDCDAVLQEDPRDVETLLNRATLHLNTRQYRDAARDYSAVLELRPNQAYALYGRGLARRASGDAGGAADLVAAKQMDPTVTQMFTVRSSQQAR